jgi:hypothetical protein
MAIIRKQLIINKLHLPSEMIDIIKEYTFYNIRDKAKKRKDKLLSLINDTLYSPIKMRLSLSEWVFWIEEENNKGVQFQNNFCVKCGNYIYLDSDIASNKNISISCRCYLEMLDFE